MEGAFILDHLIAAVLLLSLAVSFDSYFLDLLIV